MNTVPIFDKISHRYDTLNHILSFYQDKRWRKKCRKIVSQFPHNKIVDVACGTGDLTLELCKLKSSILAVDPSLEMLKIAQKKFEHHRCCAETILAPAESLPLPDESFDIATCAFGIRNFENYQKGLHEIRRILKNDGVFVIMEFGFPTNTWLKKMYMFYFSKILPKIVELFTPYEKEYMHLKTSVINFPYGERLIPYIEEIGFNLVECKKISAGIVYIYVFRKTTDS
ncbi:MAG: ubiquinone/menaquinone biosynthesis methyltransferase [Bacteroidales bacterium]|nr:ubiquinone/menaquinone biosynthesis methyltransferase [Bacteroidales bacterium]